MKKIIIFLIAVITFNACSNKIITYDDATKYNRRLASLVIKVQNPLDSLEAYLLTFKQNLEYDTTNQYNNLNFDKDLTEFLLKRTKNEIQSSIEELNYFDYKTEDNNFKQTVEKSLIKIKKTLDSDFQTIIDTLSNPNTCSSRQVLLSILPYGKSSYLSYQAAIDSIIVNQLKFSANHNYVIEKNLIRFNF